MNRSRLQRIGAGCMVAGLMFASSPLQADRDFARAEDTITTASTPAPQETAATTTAAAIPTSATTASTATESTATAAAPADPAPVPLSGNLSKLTFTATGALSASLVNPAANTASESVATKLTVSTVQGAGVEVKVNGSVVPSTRIGLREVNNKTGDTQYTFYGVVLQPGPNDIQLTPLGAEGSRGPTVTTMIYGPGKPATVVAHLVGELRADGKTPAALEIVAHDRWNHPAMPGSVIHASIASGDARLFATQDQTIGSGSVEALVPQGGTIELKIVPGLQPGDLRIALSSGELKSDEDLYVRPFVRAPLVNGLISIGSGSVPGSSDGDGNPDGGGSKRSRVSLYATGAVAANTQLSLAYSTANRLDPSFNAGGGASAVAADTSDVRYQTFGDQSFRRNDALSRDRLYARIDRDRNNAVYGEFNANTGGPNDVGGFTKLVNGTKIELAARDNRAKLMGFTARDDVSYARQTFAVTGLASSSTLLKPSIVVGSEQIILVSLDRRTGGIIAQNLLQRNIDYVLDDATGLLRFINIPLPFDAAFNPQVILAQYEYAGGPTSGQTTGGRGELGLGRNRNTRIGLSYVNDASGTNNFALSQLDMQGKFSGGSWSIARASSSGTVPGFNTVGTAASGSAWRGRFVAASSSQHVSLDVTSTSPGFGDPFGGLSTPGLDDARLTYSRRFGRATEVSFSTDAQQNRVIGGAVSGSATNTQFGLREPLGHNMTFTTSIASRSQHTGSLAALSLVPSVLNLGLNATPTIGAAALGNAPNSTSADGTSTQAQFGLEWRINKRAFAQISRSTDIGGSSISTAPAQTSAALGVDINRAGRIYVRQLWSAAPQQSFATSTSTLTSNVGATSSTAVGFEQAIGRNTSVDSEYAIEHVGNAQDVYAAIGARERVSFGKNLHGDLSFQTANATGNNVSVPAGAFDVYGANLAYTNDKRFAATLALQERTGFNGGASVQAGIAGPLGTDWSILGSVVGTKAGGQATEDARVSLAWRPSKNDRGSTLFSYDRVTGNITDLGTHTDVLSLENVYRPTHRFEFGTRVAYKLDGDGYYSAHTTLFAARADQRIGSKLDVAAEVLQTVSREVAGSNNTALGVEAGARLGGQIRVAGGYHFQGSADPSLVNTPVRRGFYATLTSVVDRLFGWGK